MNLLVTGGAGFVGANLVRHLLEARHQVVVVDDLSTGSVDNLQGLDVDFREGSILDRALLDDLIPFADAVVHLAARPSVPRSLADPMATHTVNVTGTLTVLEAVRRGGAPHVVLASSSSVYGRNPELPKSETLRTEPMSPYAASKLAAEAYSLAHAQSFGLDVLAFRFFNVFGPLQPAGHAYAAVIPAFIDAVLRGEPIKVEGDGEQTRDFTSVRSVAKVIASAVERRRTHHSPVNLAFGSRRSLNEVVTVLERLLDRPIPRETVPPRVGDVRHSQASQALLRSLFPEVEPVAFEDELRRVVEWFQVTMPATVERYSDFL